MHGLRGNPIFGFAYTPASQLARRTASNDNYSWLGANIERSYNRNGKGDTHAFCV